MGGGQSARATHYQHPCGDGSPPPEPTQTHSDTDMHDDGNERQHINISNKMIERLVEDATLAGGAAAAVAKAAAAGSVTPRGDHKDTIFVEKLRRLDDHHSEKYGLTVEEVNSLAKRVEMRTEVMLSPDPVCQDDEAKVIECYALHADEPVEMARCWDTVGAFSKCVKDAAANRLRLRTQRDAREHARRSRHMAHAREHALKDLGAPPPGSL